MGPGAAPLGGIYSTVSSSKLQGRKVISLLLLTYMGKYTHFWYGQKQGHGRAYGNQHTLQKSSAVCDSEMWQTAAGLEKTNIFYNLFAALDCSNAFGQILHLAPCILHWQ